MAYSCHAAEAQTTYRAPSIRSVLVIRIIKNTPGSPADHSGDKCVHACGDFAEAVTGFEMKLLIEKLRLPTSKSE